MSDRTPRLPAMGGLAALLVATGGCLHAIGDDDLAAPPLGSWADLVSWYERVGPDTATVAVLRLAAMGLIAWLLAGLALQVLAAVPGLNPLRPLADTISPRSLQRLGHGLAGLSLTAGLAAAAPSAGMPVTTAPIAAVHEQPTDGSPGTATMRVVEEEPSRSAISPERSSTASTTAVPPPPASTSGRTTTAGASTTTTTAPLDPRPAPPAVPVIVDALGAVPADQPVMPATVPAQPGASVETVTVEPGDSLWSIAAEAVADRDDDTGVDLREVVMCWRQLIEVNRAQLVDPTNPDLIFPGQALTLPPA